ncbi:MAG TPA: autotransporter assembly complex family protein [Alphaproteobacteria bacterium]|nr:autotransporter assembly complex family protein [Alphaproteobacteria bacterium]
MLRHLCSPAAALAALVLAQPLAAQELRYDASITAVEDGELAAALEASSNLVALEDEPVPGIAGLIRRAEADAERLNQALRSFGYYRGDVAVRIATFDHDDPALRTAALDEEAGAPVRVTLVVDPGQVYRVAEIRLVGSDGGEIPVPIDRGALPIRAGDPARSSAILATEDQLIAQMRRQGHPFAAVPDREAVVDHATREMFLTYALEPGPAAILGEVSFEGLQRVDEGFVRARVPFEVDDPYDPARIDELRDNLTETGVFSSVRVQPAGSLTAEGRLPVIVTVIERKRRFIGFGADYASDEGFGARAHWGHRNLFGGAESLRLEGEISRVGQSGEVGGMDYRLNLDFRKPDLLVPDQDLVANLQALSENPDAYERQAILGAIGIEREISDSLSAGAGLSFEYAEITQNDEADEVFLIGVPLTLSFDTTDDLLNPTRGGRVDLGVTPFPGFLGSTRSFTSTRITGTAYEDFGTDGKTVLAGRLSLGSLWGEARDDIPADKRFYAGGGGSVRGYDFQSIGPEDENGDPIGGRSVIEASVELRYRITDTIGIVPFLDAGSVYESTFPDFSEDLQFAAGIGARYYTGFGPIRVDVAVPLNKREDDSAFALYVSIGQAF